MRLRLLVAALMISFLAVRASPAAAASSGSGSYSTFDSLTTILVSGAVGGVLGLSTLSFYSKPQDNIQNIFIGAGLGLIVASIYVTATIVTDPKSITDNSTPAVSPFAERVTALERSTALRFEPWVGSGYGGIQLEKNF